MHHTRPTVQVHQRNMWAPSVKTSESTIALHLLRYYLLE
jgi:hypothetical protein